MSDRSAAGTTLALRPTREHVLPALLVLFPAEWFVLRAVGTAAVREGPVPVGWLVAGTVGGIVAAYPVAVAAVTAARALEPGGVVAAALDPSDRTLTVLGCLLAAAAGYLLVALFVVPTGPLATAAAAAGVLLGLPLVLAYTAAIAAGNAVGAGPPVVETTAVVVGLAASAAWTLGVAAAAGRLLGRLGPAAGTPGSDRERED